MSMSISERVEFEHLLRRVAVLEARFVGRPSSPLAKRNDQRKADGRRLDEALADLLRDHPRAAELTARQIRDALDHEGFSPLPAERTVRLHLAAVRGTGNAAVLPGMRD